MLLLKFLFTFCLVNGLLSGKIHPSIGKKSEKHQIEKSGQEDENNPKKSDEVDISSNDLRKEANSVLYNSDIGNLRLGLEYYLRDRTGYYIRWDGRYSINSGIKRYGLTVDFSNDTVDSDWYLFVIETYNNDLSIKNVKTGQYITNDYTGYYYLMNETTSSYPRGVRLISADNDLKIIQSTHSVHPDYLTYSNSSRFGVSYLAAVSNISNRYVAYIDFIPDIRLYAKITAFNYEQPNDTTIQNHLTKVNLISPAFVINNSSSKITHEIENEIALSQSLNWEFDQDLNIFQNVSIKKTLPSLLTSNGEFDEIESNFQYKPKSVKSLAFNETRQYTVKKTVQIESNSMLKIEAFLEKVENLKIPFTATAQITGSRRSNRPILGDQILETVNIYWRSNLTIVDVTDNSITLELNGSTSANFGKKTMLIVVNVN